MLDSAQFICGPAGSGKTSRLWERWLSVIRSKPVAALWLTPTRRRADFLRRRLLNELGGACGARILTLAELADSVVRSNRRQMQPLDHVQRRLLIDDLVAGLRAGGRLSHYERVLETLGFSEALSALLEDLRGNLVPVEEIAAAVRESGQKLQQCCLLYRAYEQALRDRGQDDEGGRTGRARDLLREGCRKPFDSLQYVFVDDFNDFTTGQVALLHALADGVT